MKRAIPILILCLIAVPGFSQMAPRDTAMTYVHGKAVAIEYGRPSLKGRSVSDLISKLEGDRIWRAGSEQVTTLNTETALKMGGQKVPAGEYSVYLHCPEDGPFSLVLNKVLGQPLGEIWEAAPENLANAPWPHMNYSDISDSEVARIPLHKTSSSEAVDLLTFAFEQEGKNAVLKVAWGDHLWTADVAAGKMEGSH